MKLHSNFNIVCIFWEVFAKWVFVFHNCVIRFLDEADAFERVLVLEEVFTKLKVGNHHFNGRIPLHFKSFFNITSFHQLYICWIC